MPTARAMKRETEYNRGRGDRRGDRASRRAGEKERRGERASTVGELLARSAVGSHGCAAYLHLLSPLFSLLLCRQPELARTTARTTALRAASSFLFSSPRVLLFQFLSLSLSLVALLASTRAQTVLSIQRFASSSRSFPFSLSPLRLAFLHVQQDVAAISERGRVYIRAY